MRWFQIICLLSIAAFALCAIYSRSRQKEIDTADNASVPHDPEDDDLFNSDIPPFPHMPKFEFHLRFEDLLILSLALISFIVFILTFPPSLYALISSNYDTFVSLISGPFVIVPAYLIGVIFYYTRTRWPLVYGLTELTAAAILIWIPFGASVAIGSKVTALLGGIYVTVRGLDNVERGLPDRFRGLWRKIFPKAPG